MASPLLSELPFGAYLCYSPRGLSDVSRNSRKWRDAVKSGKTASLESATKRLAENLSASGLAVVLGPDVTLVPVPRRAPLIVAGALWPARRVAEALVNAGLGRDVLPCLSRTKAVPKAAFQEWGERPTAALHYQTMEADAQLIALDRIALVDDILTKGDTMLGGASRIAEAYPGARVSAFALIRTLGLQPEIDEIIAPCVGKITNYGGKADRSP